MVDDFDEFARQFRQRTAARLLEFERTLAKAQEDLEKAADNAKNQASAEVKAAGKTPRTSAARPGAPARLGREERRKPQRTSVPGQVKSVLRRG